MVGRCGVYPNLQVNVTARAGREQGLAGLSVRAEDIAGCGMPTVVAASKG